MNLYPDGTADAAMQLTVNPRSYMEHAFPHDELKPLSCSFVDNFGSYALTLVDSLDTLAVLGEFPGSTRCCCGFSRE
jgi:hypothetical protein